MNDKMSEDGNEEESNQIREEVKNLSIGQEILIKIKSIKYEQNKNLFIVASFVKTF